MSKIVNKTMSRSDLLTEEAKPVVDQVNELISTLYSKHLYTTSWYGTLPEDEHETIIDRQIIKNLITNKHALRTYVSKIALRVRQVRTGARNRVGMENRGPDYQPLPDSAMDGRIPWYKYWEIFWVIGSGPTIKPGMRLLDAGGTSSLFTCYLASLGAEVHSVDIKEKLVSNGNKIARAMGWKMISYAMYMNELSFANDYFDHAYSICVFEHLDYEIKQRALSGIARCLKPNGILSITFDYRNPAPWIEGFGHDTSERNQIKTTEDIKRNFLSMRRFELVGTQEFHDNGESYLVHPAFDDAPYTFGAIFLKKVG